MLRLFMSVILVFWGVGASAQSADCTGPGYRGAMQVIEAFYRTDPVALFNTQLQRNAVAGYEVLAPDGAWGPATAAEVCALLHTYGAINDFQPAAYIRSAAEAEEFVRWMGSMARFNLNPNGLEAPD